MPPPEPSWGAWASVQMLAFALIGLAWMRGTAEWLAWSAILLATAFGVALTWSVAGRFVVPALYVLHVAEEAPGFTAWARRHGATRYTQRNFVKINGAGHSRIKPMDSGVSARPSKICWPNFTRSFSSMVEVI